MIDYKMIFMLLGGLGLFVYGMHMMSEGLQKAAGDKLKKVLEVLTTNRILGIIVGIIVTAITQSSSATTVMVIGFVNAGLMDLAQAASVIMGANIGTTITGQLIAFNFAAFAPLIIAVGTAMVLFSKKKKVKEVGEIVLGFGIIFLGMDTMGNAMKPLGSNPAFTKLIVTIGNNPFLGVLLGTAMTAVIQSSGAFIAMLIALSAGGSITFGAALPMLLGSNIGTCITAILASIGTNKTAKRAAGIHLAFNIIGTIIFMLLLNPVVTCCIL
jgi:phosphate:Na+ symporter